LWKERPDKYREDIHVCYTSDYKIMLCRNKKLYSKRQKRRWSSSNPGGKTTLCLRVCSQDQSQYQKRTGRNKEGKRRARGIIIRLSTTSSITIPIPSTRKTGTGIPENHAPGSADFTQLAKGLWFLLALLALLRAGLLHHFDHALDPTRLFVVLVRQLGDSLAIASGTGHAHLRPAVLAARTARRVGRRRPGTRKQRRPAGSSCWRRVRGLGFLAAVNRRSGGHR
jgi:hypothetical protein